MNKPVVFIDRDGVVNRDSPDYIKSWSEFAFLPRSLDAIARLTFKRFSTIIITNQSAIHRKLISLKTLESIHMKMTTAMGKHGGKIRDIFFCPHLPEEDCPCRKPKPGLLFQAQEAYRVDLAKAYVVGDSAKDIECARNAGCGHAVLVKTGNGQRDEKILAQKKIFPDHVAEDLYTAVDWIIKQQQKIERQAHRSSQRLS